MNKFISNRLLHPFILSLISLKQESHPPLIRLNEIAFDVPGMICFARIACDVKLGAVETNSFAYAEVEMNISRMTKIIRIIFSLKHSKKIISSTVKNCNL